jgi:hypothetical protein
MSMLLGRPTLINDRHCTVTPPLDCNIPTDMRSPPIPRGPLDPPTQSTHRLLDYQLAHIVNEIDDLQLESSKTMSYDLAGVERLQAKIHSLTECYPPSLALTDRDTAHDTTNPFLSAQAALLKCITYSLVVALHRPFVFTRQKSRIEIVKAGILMLESQQRLSDVTREHHHTIYTLNFYTFDPAVLIAAVIITSPLSLDQDLLDKAMIYIREGQKRMETLGRLVKLAEKGAAVLSLLVKRAERSCASSQHLRVSRSVGGGAQVSPPDSDHSPSSFTHDPLRHDSPASSISVMGEDPWASKVFEPPAHSYPTLDFGNGFAPISTGILSTRDLDEILAAPDPTHMMGGGGDGGGGGGTETLDPDTTQFGTGLLDAIDGDSFWQNLLYMPFQ